MALQEKKKRWIQEQIAEKARKELQEQTFKPKTNAFMEFELTSKPFLERLSHFVKKKEEKLNKKRQEAALKIEEMNNKELTFHPEINQKYFEKSTIKTDKGSMMEGDPTRDDLLHRKKSTKGFETIEKENNECYFQPRLTVKSHILGVISFHN